MKYVYGTAAVMATMLASTYAADDDQNQLLKTAFEFMGRAGSTSEVLTINLTSAAILVGLKILIIAAGLFAGANGGLGGFTGRRRSDEEGLSVKSSELTGGMCFIMYTAGEIDKLSCVQRTACEDPSIASTYLTAAKMWHKMHKLVNVIPFNDGYVSVMNAVEDATQHSLNGGDCSVYQW